MKAVRGTTLEVFTNRLNELRKERKMSINQVAQVSELSVSTAWRIVKGQRLPSVYIMIRLADLFEIGLDYLVGRTDERHSSKLLDDCRTFNDKFEKLNDSDRLLILTQIETIILKNQQRPS